MSDRKVERTVKILIEFDGWEVAELASYFKGDDYSELSRRYHKLFQSALAEE